MLERTITPAELEYEIAHRTERMQAEIETLSNKVSDMITRNDVLQQLLAKSQNRVKQLEAELSVLYLK